MAGLTAIFLAGPVLTQTDPGTASGEEEEAIPFALPQSGPFTPAEIEIDNDQAISDWFRSSHANAASDAFSHWDDDGEIRAACATCHSGEGFRDFHGLDGTPAGVVDGPINVGGVVDCGTCHNAGLADITEITFPSGLVHPVTGVEASCLTCHQGRSAGIDVAEATSGLADDEPNSELRFINPHYATAAATWLGGYGAAGYHYDGQDYSGRFFHARPVASCNSCHEPHTLEVEFEPCLTCHLADRPEDIRIARQSYDGSGDTSVGISSDIERNADTLLGMIRDYSDEVVGAPVIYDGTRFPYFFSDANGDGVIDTAEGSPVAYQSWTPRSLRTAFNWKLVTADPGNYAHNPQYSLELLYDSIMDLSAPLGIDMEDLQLLR
ncbi:cytochrome c3 family protein [Rhodophyticola porphyridii]|uniref:Cytochrome C n=1 Tax=Rhodophyticola porphyridii TaxID=1852017 RepID=A0A3L9YBJ4_9RHOB|nr:cytochrome c3 family protein [Rhodophyticola porphyridii]RMA43366.1 cytochrome C [Rhodophyticola porphyridii]